MKNNLFSLSLTALTLGFSSCKQKVTTKINYVISAPAGSQYTHITTNGPAVLPNGRIITPTGRQIKVAPHPYGLTLSNDGSIAVTANSGTSPLSISIRLEE